MPTQRCLYHPSRQLKHMITQKYKDQNKEVNLAKLYKSDLINTIAKGYDNELRNIQTYDIITKRNSVKKDSKKKRNIYSRINFII